MTKDIEIDVTFSNVTKLTGGDYKNDYGCDATFASTAQEVQPNGDIDLSEVKKKAKLIFTLKTTSFTLNNQTYDCRFPDPLNESFWIGPKKGPPPQKGNAPPFAGKSTLDGQFAVGNNSEKTKAILEDENDGGGPFKYCLLIQFEVGGAKKEIVIDPVIINRRPAALQ